MSIKIKTEGCLRCGGPMGASVAVSRVDNVTMVCSECGTEEASVVYDIQRRGGGNAEIQNQLGKQTWWNIA